MRKQQFTMQDYLDQLTKVNKLGSFKSILTMFGVSDITEEQEEQIEKQFKLNKAIIQSMTTAEKNDPDILNAGRRKRIAEGAGTTVQQVNILVKQYTQTKLQMKQLMNNKGSIMKMASKLGKNMNPEDLKNFKF